MLANDFAPAKEDAVTGRQAQVLEYLRIRSEASAGTIVKADNISKGFVAACSVLASSIFLSRIYDTPPPDGCE